MPPSGSDVGARPRMIGRVFLGRHEARRLLGEGGMGKVYLARQLDLARDVVVKVMQLQGLSTASLVPDARALAATFGAAVLAAMVFGLPPALRLASLVPRVGRTRTIFLGVQVAVSCLLLVVSSLLVGSRQRLGAVDPGFDFRQLLTCSSFFLPLNQPLKVDIVIDRHDWP